MSYRSFTGTSHRKLTIDPSGQRGTNPHRSKNLAFRPPPGAPQQEQINAPIENEGEIAGTGESTNRTYFYDGAKPQASDMFIAVMGVTGVGKSTFISHLAERAVKIGHDMEACEQTPRISN